MDEASKAAKRKRAAGVKAAKKCKEAADAIYSYIYACNAAGDGSGVTRTDDQRLLFARDLLDYQRFLEQRYA